MGKKKLEKHYIKVHLFNCPPFLPFSTPGVIFSYDRFLGSFLHALLHTLGNLHTRDWGLCLKGMSLPLTCSDEVQPRKRDVGSHHWVARNKRVSPEKWEGQEISWRAAEEHQDLDLIGFSGLGHSSGSGTIRDGLEN